MATTHKCAECGHMTYAAKPVVSRIDSDGKAAAFLADMATLDRERFEIITLNIQLTPIKRHTIATGSGSSCAVDPKDVFSAALRDDAAAIIVAHNHPSGDSTPSAEDNSLTERLKAGAELVGLRFVDHIIVAKGEHFSYRAAGRF